jgi:hypothetical protein
MKAFTRIAFTAVLSATFAPISLAGWHKTTDIFVPDNPAPLDKTGAFSYGMVRVFSTGERAFGIGDAFDSAPGTDVRLEQSAQANHVENWTYTAEAGEPATGKARLEATGTLHARLDLQDPTCSGASVGFAAIDSDLLDEPQKIDADLAKMTSTAGDLGTITLFYEALEWSKVISYSTGTGEFAKSQNNVVAGDDKCTNKFTINRESQVEIDVFADDWFVAGTGAKVTSAFNGKWKGKVFLSFCTGGSEAGLDPLDTVPPNYDGSTPLPPKGGKGRTPASPGGGTGGLSKGNGGVPKHGTN